MLILKDSNKINIIEKNSINNYSGNNELLSKYKLDFQNLENSLLIYENNLNIL